MRAGPDSGGDRQRRARCAGRSRAIASADFRTDHRGDPLGPGKECPQPVEHESGSLFDDPVSGVVNILDFEVTHAIRIAPQQRRRDHRIFASMQHSNRHIDAAVCVSATNQPHRTGIEPVQHRGQVVGHIGLEIPVAGRRNSNSRRANRDRAPRYPSAGSGPISSCHSHQFCGKP